MNFYQRIDSVLCYITRGYLRSLKTVMPSDFIEKADLIWRPYIRFPVKSMRFWSDKLENYYSSVWRITTNLITNWQVTRSVVLRCTSEKFRSPRAVFALASDGALTLYVHYRAPNQYHESFKTNSYVKFSEESIAIWIFQIKRAPFGENRNCLFKMEITF